MRVVQLTGCAFVVLLGVRAEATVTFRYATDQSDYAVAPGGQVAVPIFLEERIGGGDTSVLVAEGGLFSAGLKIFPLSPLPTHPAAVSSLPDIVADPAFTGGSLQSLEPLTLLLSDGILAEPGPQGQVIAAGVRQVLLGTFRFTAGGVAGEVSHFKISDYDDYGISSDTLTWQGTELDNSISPGQFTITTVIPEPSAGLTLLAAGFLASLHARPRSWRTRRSL